MCGIFGIHADPSFKFTRQVAGILAYYASFRGTDSWGVVTDKGSGPTVIKGLGDITAALPALSSALTRSRIVLGHTRYATQGAVSLRNAHPFEFNRHLLVHNGTLSNEHEHAAGLTYEVDSEVLLHAIAHGDTERISKLRGYGAVAFIEPGHPARHRVARLQGGSLRALRLTSEQGLAYAYISSLAGLGSGKDKVARDPVSDLRALGLEVEILDALKEGAVYAISKAGFRRTDTAYELAPQYSYSRGVSRYSYGRSYTGGPMSVWTPPTESLTSVSVDDDDVIHLLRTVDTSRWGSRLTADYTLTYTRKPGEDYFTCSTNGARVCVKDEDLCALLDDWLESQGVDTLAEDGIDGADFLASWLALGPLTSLHAPSSEEVESSEAWDAFCERTSVGKLGN